MQNRIENNRETWLQKGANYMRSYFAENGYECPDIQVSVGFTGGNARKNKAIGSCWTPEAAADKISHIFICPTIDDGSRALDILLHEMVHATVGNDKKHGPIFKKCALAVGLTGKMTATVASENLKADLDILIKNELGPYPHGALTRSTSSNDKKKQTTRMIKVMCDSKCTELSVRVSNKWIESNQTPLCPICHHSMQPQQK